MRPIFTIHAGEYLVADYIERHYRKPSRLRVWVPSKDDGIDLLVTSADCQRSVSLQVKFSKDFDCGQEYDASGWWSLKREKIRESRADYWVFVLPRFESKRKYDDCFYFFIPPALLIKRLEKIHGKAEVYNMYLTVCNGVVIATRGMRQKDRNDSLNMPDATDVRNFSQFLNAWSDVLKKVK